LDVFYSTLSVSSLTPTFGPSYLKIGPLQEGGIVPKSVLEAIKMGLWNYEPKRIEETSYEATKAMPGTQEKLEIMALRVKAGLPLWHHDDQTEYLDE
jgi:hypothetical protein